MNDEPKTAQRHGGRRARLHHRTKKAASPWPPERTNPAAQLFIVGLLLASSWGCAAPAVDQPPPSVLLVTIGDLRADNAWASQALQPVRQDALEFHAAYSPSSLSVQSLASIFVGRLPTHAGTIGASEAQPPEAATTLATRLRQSGWQTAFIAQTAWASRPGFTRGFDIVEVPSESDWEASEVTRRAIRALQALGNDEATSSAAAGNSPFLLAVHYEIFGNSFEKPTAAESEPVEAEWADIYSRRSEAVLEQVATLSHELSNRDVVLVVAGVSGFELGEHGGTGNGFTVYDEVTRVPLLLRSKGRTESQRSDTAVSTADVTRSILDLAGVETAAGDVTGSSLVAAAGQTLRVTEENQPVIVEVVVREWAIARAIVGERLKYLHSSRAVPVADRDTVRAGLIELQAAMQSGAAPLPALFGEAVLEELFDLQSDPGESRSILADNPPGLSRLRGLLRDYRRLCETSAYEPGEITERLEVDLEKLRELESLGYL